MCALERGPSRAQAIRIPGAPVGAAGETTVELGFDEWDHVDAVDAEEAFAIEEPRCVDVRPRHVDPRITTPDRSARMKRAPHRSVSTNSAACSSSDLVKVAMASPVERAPRG